MEYNEDETSPHPNDGKKKEEEYNVENIFND